MLEYRPSQASIGSLVSPAPLRAEGKQFQKHRCSKFRLRHSHVVLRHHFVHWNLVPRYRPWQRRLPLTSQRRCRPLYLHHDQ